MGTLVQELLYSIRSLRKSTSFVIVTVMVLALGIGANTAIFSVVNSVLLRPLPYRQPDRLVVTLHEGSFPVSPADYLDYRSAARSFEDMAAAQGWRANLTTGDQPEAIPGLQVTTNMIALLGVPPMLGRGFTAADGQTGAPKTVLLSHGLWQRRFGGDRGIVGREIRLDQTPYTVVGVMPPAFRFAPFWITQAQMWTPLDLEPRKNDRDGRSLRVFARLRDGVSAERAQAEMDSIAQRLAETYPATNAKLGIRVVPLLERVVGNVRTTLLVLLGTVAFVFLIACANVANLTLTRAASRRKEMALRLAMGAGRWRLVRLALTEMLCLAALGGAAGIAIAHEAIGLLAVLLPPGSLPRQHEVAVDATALLFAGGLALVGALLAGALPAWQAARADLNEALKEGGRGASAHAGGRGTRGLLIAAETALSVVLLAGAGLMIRTSIELQRVDAGFQPADLLTLQVSVAGTDYNRGGRRAPVFRQVRDALAAVPGVESASAINHLPIGGDIWRLGYAVEGRSAPPPGERPGAAYRVAMPGYFHAMGIPLLEGRDFSSHDDESAPGVAIVNQAMARRQWPGESALGKRIRFGVDRDASQPLTVIGVVKNARQNDWTSPAADEIYVPYYQRPNAMGLSYLTFVLRTQADPAALAGAARDAVGRAAQGLAVSDVETMERVIADGLWRPRLATLLLGMFAAVALLLAAVGIYGVVSYSVRARTQEIGIRMALGANTADVWGMAFREGMRPVAAGGAVGLVAALGLTRLMSTLLYGVTPSDPSTFAGVVGTLLAVAAAANVLPAVRAARVDPMTALRSE